MRIPPYSKEDELFVLGSVMLDKDVMSEIFEILSSDDFYFDSHKTVFETCSRLFLLNVPVDLQSVLSELRKANRLEAVGGGELLVEAVNSVSTTIHGVHHARAVRGYSILRRLISSCSTLMEDCYSHEDEPEDVLERAEKEIFKISDSKLSSKLEIIGPDLHEFHEQLEKIYENKSSATGLPSGFRDLDDMTGGFQDGNLVMLAARPGMGKTSLALDITRHTVLSGVPVAFFSLEMTKQEIMLRLLSAMSGVGVFQLRTGRFRPVDWLLIQQASARLYESDLYLDSSSFSMTPISIRSASRRLASKMARDGKKLGLVIVDYLQLMSSKASRYESRQSEVADISRSLKAMAIDLEVPVLALSQLNRQTEEAGRSGRPRLSDLRESGALEQDSDLVMFIYRQAFYKSSTTDDEKSAAKLIVAKHRNGRLGEVDLFFERELTRFRAVEKVQSEEPEVQRGAKID